MTFRIASSAEMCVIYDWTSAQQANKGFSGGEAKEVFSTDTDVKHDPENEKKIQDGGQNQKSKTKKTPNALNTHNFYSSQLTNQNQKNTSKATRVA